MDIAPCLRHSQSFLDTAPEGFRAETEQSVRRDGDEIGAQIDKLGYSRRIGWTIPAGACKLAACSDLWNDLTHHTPHLRLNWVSHALSQVTRRHVKDINTLNGKNVVQVLNRHGVLNHRNDQRLGICMAD
jgi:hypothetical protein